MADQPNSAAPESSLPDELTGTVIDGRYRIGKCLGQGGMGTVYKAEHITIRKDLAIKLLDPSMATLPTLAERFEREAFAIGRIDHPNCIDVSDFGSLSDGSLYLVMEFLDGESLGDLLFRTGAQAMPRALHIARHMARGLAHVHAADIVHRDIKPDNIVLINREGDPFFAKLLDFGIAKLIGDAKPSSDNNLTQAGMAFGTPAYMSPEQTVGAPVDPRADLYSLCVVIFEMIAGRPPFTSEDKLELLGMHAHKPPPTLAEANPELKFPKELEALVAKGLAKKPEDRFQTAGKLLEAIDDCMNVVGEPVPGVDLEQSGRGGVLGTAMTMRPAPVRTTWMPEEQPKPKRRRSPGLLAVLAVLAVLAIAVGGFAVVKGFGLARGDADDANGHRARKPERAFVDEARVELKRGNAKRALHLLEEGGAPLAKNPRALLVKGHALSALREHTEALTAYQAAIAADASLKGDNIMRSNLKVVAEDKMFFERATTVLIQDLGDDSARDALIERTLHPKNGEWRHMALNLAEELDLGGRVDRRAFWELHLSQGRRCKNRREAVAKLRALGDAAAIPALEEAISRTIRTKVAPKKRRGKRKRRKPRFKNVRVNSCLAEDATEAVKYLHTLSQSQSSGNEQP